VAQRVLREPHHLLGENPNRGVEAHNRRRAHERAWNVLGAVEVIARSRGMSMAQLARTWLVDRPTVCAVILGARHPGTTRRQHGAAGSHLSDEDLPSRPSQRPQPGRLPYGGHGVEQRSRQIFGDN
jgi:aryl-alcohol dehydrogenase-like predicted oxidoreductase